MENKTCEKAVQNSVWASRQLQLFEREPAKDLEEWLVMGRVGTPAIKETVATKTNKQKTNS